MRRTFSLILPAVLLAACAGDEITAPVPGAPVRKRPSSLEGPTPAGKLDWLERGWRTGGGTLDGQGRP